jgi:hypothetical protein
LNQANIFFSSQIDQAGVAAALGMTNVRSAGNKISALKKKYNLPLGTSLKAGSSDAGPSVPKTTKNDKVKKTPTKKKAVASKAQLKADKVKKQSEEEDEQEQNGEEAAEKDGDETDEKDDRTDEA